MNDIKIRSADYIASRLSELGCTHVFTVTGGGAMHLNDAFGRCKKFKIIYMHHEQAAAMAAESYARLTSKPAIVCVTTGPGGINSLNGVFGAYTDSIPMIVISGQVRYDTTVLSTSLPLRQLGDQEFASIIDCARTVTKYATTVNRYEELEYIITKSWTYATSGRPGPVWIDIPMNIQGALVEKSQYGQPYQKGHEIEVFNGHATNAQICLILDQLAKSKRPLVYTGAGIRVANADKILISFIEKYGIPIVTGWNAHDVIANAHSLYAGRPGILGDRPGNFAVQAADFILVLGARLSIRQVGYNWKTFAPNAFIAMVDIDPFELFKPTIRVDLAIHANLYNVIEQLNNKPNKTDANKWQQWKTWLNQNKQNYPVVSEKHYTNTSTVNPYYFIDVLFKLLPDEQIVVAGDGTACVVGFQSAVIKSGTRFYHNSGCASMGYDLPAAIGAASAIPDTHIVCITGDGSIQMNIQELQTIIGYNLPITIFIINNNGYHSIRQTQLNFFGEPLYGVHPESGLTFPNLEKIALAYGFEYIRITHHPEIEEKILDCLNTKQVICEVVVDANQNFEPKASSKRLPDGNMVSMPLECMAPFLPDSEIDEVMKITKEEYCNE